MSWWNNLQGRAADNKSLLLMSGLGLLSGNTPQQGIQNMAQMGMMGSQFDTRRSETAKRNEQRNKTMDYFRAKRPDLYAQVEAGMPVADAWTIMHQAKPGPKPTSAIKEYEYAKNQGFEGSFTDFQTALKKSGATNITVGNNNPGLGKLSTDYGYVLDPTTGNPRINQETGLPQAAPVPGSPADVKLQQQALADEKAQTAQQRYSNVVLEDIGRAKKLVKENPATTGLSGQMIRGIGGTAAHDVQSMISTIVASIGFDRLQAMRDASPTGGALGQVSEMELKQLNATLGSLEQSQSQEQMLYNLERLERIYAGIAQKAAAYPNAAQFGFEQATQATQPAQQQEPGVVDFSEYF